MSDSAKNYCALVIAGMVDAIIVADYEWATSNLEGDWHDLHDNPDNVACGWLYDAETDTFVAPPASEVDE